MAGSQLSMHAPKSRASQRSSVVAGVSLRRTSSVSSARQQAMDTEAIGRRKRKQLQEFKTMIEMREKILGSDLTTKK